MILFDISFELFQNTNNSFAEIFVTIRQSFSKMLVSFLQMFPSDLFLLDHISRAVLSLVAGLYRIHIHEIIELLHQFLQLAFLITAS